MARVNPQYNDRAASAECVSTPTPELMAATPGGQFLAAAPCGPDGKPLATSSQPRSPQAASSSQAAAPASNQPPAAPPVGSGLSRTDSGPR
jgi:hypothetical protein